MDYSMDFSVKKLTEAINFFPYDYGKVNKIGLFREKPTSIRTVTIEEYEGTLSLLPSVPVGAPATQAERGYRTIRTFHIPHIPYETTVRVADVEGVRAFGTSDTQQPLNAYVVDRLKEMRTKFEITLEYLKIGALKGLIMDGAGRTLYDLFQTYGITQKSVDFKLGTTTTDVPEKLREVTRYIEDSLMGEVSAGTRIYVSPEFYDKLIKHKSITEKYLNSPDSQELRRDNRIGFKFESTTIEEYRLKVGNTRFIPEGEGIAFPEGTKDTFIICYAPADFEECVGTLGLPFYAKLEKMKFGRGYELHTQSNPLPLCLRPAVLVKVYSSD